MNGFTPERPGARQFPDGFLWGTGTSAYQIEGAVNDDGRAPSIWDVFTHTPGTIHNGDTGDVACNSYHRLDDDIELLVGLGVNAYRFSVSWPQGPAVRRRAGQPGAGSTTTGGWPTRLRESGIVPVATLYHWDLPQALSERGGWPNRDTAELLAEYAAIVGEALGDLVGMWITVNEPLQVVNQGYRTGTHAPGCCDETAAAAATHHIMLAHGLALQALRATAGSEAKIGIADRPESVRGIRRDGSRGRRHPRRREQPYVPGPGAAGPVPDRRARPHAAARRADPQRGHGPDQRADRFPRESTSTGRTTSVAATGTTCGIGEVPAGGATRLRRVPPTRRRPHGDELADRPRRPVRPARAAARRGGQRCRCT